MFFVTEGLIAKEDDSRIIRRAYLDLIGCVPTVEEIEWYCVYNDDGYQVAINYLIDHPQNKWKAIPKEFIKNILNSEEYKNSKRYLTEEEIKYNILYVAGYGNKPCDIEVAKKRLVSDAIKCSNSDLDIIDYMSNILISRSTNIKEANYLLKHYREFHLHKSPEERWLHILERIISMEDFITK